MRRINLAIALVATVLVAACAAGSATALPAASSGSSDATTAPVATAVSGRIDVGGHSLYYGCFGQGSPTVILEHGLGGDMGQWADVFAAIQPRTRVCGYDRANADGSDPVSGTRTAADSVADLHALLTKADIPGPYVLGGFSWGGLISQLYARTYPKDIAGLVLVDSNNAEEADTYWAAGLTPAQVAEDKKVTEGPNPEHVDILASFDLVRAAPAMPDVPLVVVSHTVADPNEWPTGWDPKKFDALQAGLQADLVKLTTNGKQVFAEGAGHDIPMERPDVVAAAILELLSRAGGS